VLDWILSVPHLTLTLNQFIYLDSHPIKNLIKYDATQVQ